jgi:hypothetical protein
MNPVSFVKLHLGGHVKQLSGYIALASLGSGEKLPAREAIFAEYGMD